MKKQLFLSHAWGPDLYMRDNHSRVRKLSNLLKIKGWTTWLDENEIYDNIDYSILTGISNADAILICLTSSYFSKLNKAIKNPTNRDSCLKEWTLASSSNKILIPVIMEKYLLNVKNWPTSIISLYLGYTYYFDFSTDDNTSIDNFDKRLKKYNLSPVFTMQPAIIKRQNKLNMLDKIVHSFSNTLKTKGFKNRVKSTGNLLKIGI